MSFINKNTLLKAINNVRSTNKDLTEHGDGFAKAIDLVLKETDRLFQEAEDKLRWSDITHHGLVGFSISNKDIATIEALHDLLFDDGYHIDHRALKEARGLTTRMYDAIDRDKQHRIQFYTACAGHLKK